MANDVVSRFLGGPPLSVLARLALLSIVVGVILSAIGAAAPAVQRNHVGDRRDKAGQARQ